MSLIPSWQLYIRRRDIFRYHLVQGRDALRLLLKEEPATRLQAERRQLQRRAQDLLASSKQGKKR